MTHPDPLRQPGSEGDGAVAPASLALLRFSGELTLKASATRRRFTKRLVANLKDALAAEGLEGRVLRDHDRLYAETRGTGDVRVLARCFGLQSLSIVEERHWRTLDDLVAAGTDLFREAVTGKRFAVRARRVGERSQISVRSQQLAITLGDALGRFAAGVDLDHPEITVNVEITPARAFFFAETIRAPGGLPLGVEGRAIALVSGGFDSAVAAWLLQKRGVALDYLFCNLGGRPHQLGTLRVMKCIADDWSYGARPHLHSVDFDWVTRNIREKCEPRYWQVILKRLMLRAADTVARERKSAAIVTGEVVGQVSSQTLQNLAVISQATSLPILRPLVGFNKDEIIALARRIGTEKFSKEVDEYCAMVPGKPATHARLDAILHNEERLDPELLQRAVAERSVINLRELDLDKHETPELQASAIDAGTIVIDLRSTAAYRGWHYPDALHLEFPKALAAYSHFDKSKRYIAYCEFGLKSAHLAELMCREGIAARHFSGGLSALIAYAHKRGIETPAFEKR